MENAFKPKTKVTLRWVLVNTCGLALAIAGTCYHYQPAANLSRFATVLMAFLALGMAIGRKDPGARFRARTTNLPPAKLSAGYDCVMITLFASHGWFWMAGCWVGILLTLQLARILVERPVTAKERGKAMILYYGANANVQGDERLPYLLADLQISEGEAFMPALHKSYSYAASEEEPDVSN